MKQRNSPYFSLALGLSAGAGLMYYLDPNLGRRRRAMVADKTRHFGAKGIHEGKKALRDLGHRIQGFFAQAQWRFRKDEVSDEVLEARVRSQMGRLVSHPSAVLVRAEGGKVTLTGPILAYEADTLLSEIKKVRGVEQIENNLNLHKRAENVPDLQGGFRREMRPELLQENWAPGIRLFYGGLGLGLFTYGMKERGVFGIASSLIGGGLFLRCSTNLPYKRLFGVGTGRRAISFQKTVYINAPVEEVFAFWADFQNFPKFMRNIKNVTLFDGNNSRWVVQGPIGTPVDFYAEMTSSVPNEVIAWKTVRDSVIRHAGIVQFQKEGEGTRVQIRMQYNPPAGALGHIVASLFGANPKAEMDEDLVRMKTFLETGKPARDAAQHENAA